MITNPNGSNSDRHILDTWAALSDAPDEAARLKIVEGFTFGNAMSTAKRIRDIYSKLPRRPWIATIVSSVGVGGVILALMWVGSVKTSVAQNHETNREQNSRLLQCERDMGDIKALSVKSAADVERVLDKLGVKPSTRAQRSNVARKLGFTLDAESTAEDTLD